VARRGARGRPRRSHPAGPAISVVRGVADDQRPPVAGARVGRPAQAAPPSAGRPTGSSTRTPATLPRTVKRIWCTGATPARASSRCPLGDRRMARCARCRWWRSGDDFATRVGSRAHEHRHVLQQASILRARPKAARS
jgi:hypothetical protein